MSLLKPIGGYFGLEPGTNTFPYNEAILLNTARNCLEYILKNYKPKRVYIPKYTCSAVLEPLSRLNIEYSFYKINENLEITNPIKLAPGEYIIYTNYFGIKDAYIPQISKDYQNQLILDNSQAFYSQPLKIGHTFYSPRKFFGVPDGGILFTNKILDEELPTDISFGRMAHLSKRIDIGAEAGYEDFKHNDASLMNQPIKHMSTLTRHLLNGIDYTKAKQKREANFALLHDWLGSRNKLMLDLGSLNGPMAYPFWADDSSLKQKLINQKVFVATYWPNIFEWCRPDELEYKITQNLLALPIDQRYGQEDMERIVRIING